MSNTKTTQKPGQIDDVLFSLVSENMIFNASVEQPEDIHIEDEFHPETVKMVDAARSQIKSPLILSLYDSRKTPEELSYLTVIDNYCTLFSSMKREKVVKVIEKKLLQNEPLEDVTKFAALEFGDKISKKDKKKMMDNFLSSVNPIVEDYLKQSRDIRESLRARVPKLEKLVDTYKQVEEKKKELDDERHSGLKYRMFREFTKDIKENVTRISKATLKYSSLGLVGLLPNELSSRLIESIEEKGLLDRHQDNEETAYICSFAIEMLTPVVASVALAINQHEPQYLFGILSVIPLFMYENARGEMGMEGDRAGSLLITAPYYVGKGIYSVAKGIFYQLPKMIGGSIKEYKDELKARAIKGYDTDETKGKTQAIKKSNPI